MIDIKLTQLLLFLVYFFITLLFLFNQLSFAKLYFLEIYIYKIKIETIIVIIHNYYYSLLVIRLYKTHKNYIKYNYDDY